MEYYNLVMQALSAAFTWLAQIYTADPWLFSAFLGLVFVSMVVNLFIRPFMQGMVEGAGSDFVSRKRRDKAHGEYHLSNKDHQLRLPGGFE